MLFRLVLVTIFITFLAYEFVPKGMSEESGCIVRACERGYEDGCLTKEESAALDEACAGKSCGMCLEGLTDNCYRQHGVCVKTATGCGWQPNTALKQCIGLTKSAEAIKKSRNPDAAMQELMGNTSTNN